MGLSRLASINRTVAVMLLIPLIIGLNPFLSNQHVTSATATAAVGVSAGQIT